MATYYVRTDGNNNNAGTGSSTSAAWATVAHALGGTGTASGVVGGDTIYIAPGKYAGLTVGVSPSSTLNVIGDPSATQFANAMLPGPVYISNTQDRSTAAAQVAITISSKNNFLFRNLVLGGMTTTASHNLTIDRCYMHMYQGFVSTLIMTFSAGVNANLLITNSFFQTGGFGSRPVDITCGNHSTPYQSTIRIYNCDLMDTASSNAIRITSNNAYDIIISNCLIQMGIEHTGTYSSAVKVINTVLQTISSNTTGNIIENYNMFLSSLSANRTNVTAGFNSFVAYAPLLFGDVLTQNSLGPYHKKTPSETVFNQLVGYGTDTDAPTTDFFGRIYSSPRPIGLLTPSSLQGTSSYFPSERNASTITIAPGSTSQSIELYLGATGLTASTAGLSARYNRTRTASVNIPLVARTIAQAWTAGGFAEVDATNMPGVYRLDLPDAALAAGADDVTVVVRGASGTNGAVMTIKLSSGGLTSAQTASAVWDAARASYATAGSFGEYVNAELVTPVTSAALVRMGPYEVKADGLGASDPLDIQKGAQHGVDIQCVDGNGNGIDITSATVTAKVYNSGGSLVDTYSCTATYAADGRATFTIDTTVTNSPGTYTATITRTTGASDTQVFGPLRIYVRDI